MRLHQQGCNNETGCPCPEGEVVTLVFIKNSPEHRAAANATRVVARLMHGLEEISRNAYVWDKDQIEHEAEAAKTDAVVISLRPVP